MIASRLLRGLKRILPSRASYALRRAKSSLVDRELNLLESLAREVGGGGKAAVDVGANVGIYSGMLARHFGRVVAVEPHPECVRYLRRVLPRNCLVVAAAASAEGGSTRLRVPLATDAPDTTRATIAQANNFAGMRLRGTMEIEVETKRLDDICGDALPAGGPVALIKIDVEGHERAVLQGAERLLRVFRPALFLELEERHGTRVDEILRYLAGLDYRMFEWHGGRFVPRMEHVGAVHRPGAVNVILLANADHPLCRAGDPAQRSS